MSNSSSSNKKTEIDKELAKLSETVSVRKSDTGLHETEQLLEEGRKLIVETQRWLLYQRTPEATRRAQNLAAWLAKF